MRPRTIAKHTLDCSQGKRGKRVAAALQSRPDGRRVEVEHIGIISDEMREVVESEWPELAHKLPPKGDAH